ncbi:MlaD family protein [Nocardioides marmoribigeumensis]|jgi:phospholipid/cholesterol/gamma-HCH transport system substrate-binding protein|uniref:Phospholipid/cholesterol/gamma-HCH transport system substrate-binding protein n=1 Tax=Nocardioides marmoribigeumensis TaxID=433649 RepID=A0ABU2BWA2_9ACTN|nr:MlaD family protein [Nocardioides marmoribigeumensis]MDR7362918.1 phospholipid/cholesterol/gamma-HCH transport system substrate-binding protein [Nocardioides marmoribigeumensis]
MRFIDKQTAGDSIRLIIFVVVTTLATGLLALTIGNVSFGDKTHYKAVFSDVTGVAKGDDVRVAGVKVGSVAGVKILNRTKALVDFDVQSTTKLTGATYATIRYRNLVGQRYISLAEGAGSPAPLQENGTIPESRTTPALDLTVLFNGFKPLFAALTPSDINKFAYQIIQVFQGEGGTLEGLLARTASVTNTLASRDQLIGNLIADLNRTLRTVGDRDQQLSDLIIQFRRFVGGLKDDRQAILGSLDSISSLAVQTSDLVQGVRPGLVGDIKQVRKLAGTINRNRGEVNRALGVLPVKLQKVGRTAIYGSWFNFYLCEFKGQVVLPGSRPIELPAYETNTERCHIG